MVVAGSGAGVSYRLIMSHACSIGERSEDLAGQGTCRTSRRTQVCGLQLLCWKITSPSCRKNCSRTGLITVQYNGHCLLSLQKHQMWPRVITVDPHAMNHGLGPVCRGWMHSIDPLRPSLAYRFIHLHVFSVESGSFL